MSSSTAPAGVQATPKLTISHVETIPIRVPLGRVYRGSHYQMTHRSTIITRVHTEEGIVGEAYAGDEDAGLLEIDAIIHREIVPSLLGQDGFAVERCWELARPATFDILRDRRLGLVACACVDSAIWDAIGKALGQPLWRLWGGFRDTIPMISIGGYYDSPLSVAEQVAELRERGLAGMKFKVGGLTPAEDAKRFKEARAAAGPDFVLAADANQGWSVRDAIAFSQLVADDDLLWFEEPCQWHNDRRAMRDVRMVAGVRVCAGQSEFSAGGCRDLMVEGAIDVCNFDASWSGGPTEWRRVAGMARAFDVQMGHHEEPQVSSHLLASIPHGGYAECFDPDRDPIWWNLIANRPPLVDGAIALPTEPGFGWELDWEYVDRYRLRTS
ncbi:mandelate racemase/muconate lactonizing enzyme family protein [Conexibacter arvalis]|uniref:L-alanine-DL-glutamate epimerase-like enolase superfamily enzyme n=1 Tax=Conexibacter arvalis TaxID=912552 RepID=A0A840IGE2_9ACTN|nr:mandelate racemase/muconate lactonizing enzyme family protein [Conexibacter arvalis]MBB4663263.1 L-alanine-DL-glutamate epimerase-like enolase superfamily enzyme [Conexibacter arvalis]